MRNVIVVLFFISLFGNAQNTKNNELFNVSSSICIPDSGGLFQIRYNYTYNVYEFYKTLRYFYTYNSNKKLTNTLVLSDTTWTNLSYYTNTYDANNNLIDSLYQNWNSTYWANNTKYYLSYDVNNNRVSIIEKLFSFSSGNWDNYIQTFHTYDLTNKVTSLKSQQWDYINNFWWNTDSVNYKYDINNRLISRIYYKSPYGLLPNWGYYGKDTTMYNLANKPYYSLKKYWDNSNNQWRDLQKTSWTYDSSNRLTSKVIQDWNVGMNWWQNNISEFYSYDFNGVSIHDSSYVDGGVLRYYNSCVSAGITEKNMMTMFSISPNPVNSILLITPSADYYSAKIINSIGQLVSVIENKPNTISVSDLSNGIYFIQLLDKKGTLLKTEKFIKE